MTTRYATAEWTGTLKDGHGKFEVGSHAVQAPYNFVSRFESGTKTNPEELVGAAHAACYSMFVSALLSEKKLNPESIVTIASVTLGKDETGPKITGIHLECKVKVADISEEEFAALADKAKANCPISRLYAGTTVTLSAGLV
jgi:osmotically inducible protein OsmC